MHLASLCPCGALCNVNVHVSAKPPFYLVFVLFWFCSETCQNEALRQQLQGGSAAVFPFGFGIVLLPGEPKRRGGLPLSPQLSLGGWLWASVPSGLGCPQPGPPRGPGSGSGREAASASVHSPMRSLGLGAGRAALVPFFGEDIEFHARCFMYYIYNINISKSVLVSF